MKMTYTPIREQNRSDFDWLMRQYSAKLDSHSGSPTPPEFLQKWIDSIISLQMQGDSDRHLEYCHDGEKLIGFLYGKIDHPEHHDFKKIGYGYIMEFFILPEYRRNGYGTAMFSRLGQLFFADGATRMYLTTDSPTGEQFWETMGFAATGEISPENHDPIYEKEVTV